MKATVTAAICIYVILWMLAIIVGALAATWKML